MKSSMTLKVEALSENESFIRVTVAAFATRLNPTLEEIADIKTAVSEAVTNCVVHAYKGGTGDILVRAFAEGKRLSVSVADFGCGIENVEAAMQPFFSTAGDSDRSGMGFTVMQTFMDSVEVVSKVGEGTTVTMTKDMAFNG